MKQLFGQVIRFGVVGVIATLIDMGLLLLLREVMHMDVLLASAIGFSVSMVVNYLLSMRFVFRGKEGSKCKEFTLFAVLSIGGLCVNQGLMWLGVRYLHRYYLAVKVFAAVVVTVYNFVTRKFLLEAKKQHGK